MYLSMAVRPEHAMYYHTTGGGWSGAIDFVADEPSDEPFWSSTGFSDFVPYVGFSDDDRALQVVCRQRPQLDTRRGLPERQFVAARERGLNYR